MNFTVLALALFALTATSTQARAQSVYLTPYAFTNFAGLPSDSGTNDGTGSAARFSFPAGVAVDSASNVYVADESNHTIRKITPAGEVTTLAGLARSSGTNDGTGDAARFNHPFGVAVDSATNIYIADERNNTIRKITPVGTNWMVTTLAGSAGEPGSDDGTNSAARFNQPYGVAVDSAGNVYVADSLNGAIRKITPAGAVTTLLGGFTGPVGVAVDSATNIYVVDYLDHKIWKITPAGALTGVAGDAGVPGSDDGTNSAARFNNPGLLAVDSATNLYVADYGNHTIRKITPVGTNWLVTTLAGSAGSPGSDDGIGSEALFNNPVSVGVDGATNLYVADGLNHRITKGTPPTLTISRQISNIVHHFTPPDPMFGDPGYVTDEIIFDTAGLTNINLSWYGTFELRLFAPAGQRIVVNCSTNYTSFLYVYFSITGAVDSISHFAPPGAWSFENFSGVLPVSTYNLFGVSDAGNWFEFGAGESYSGDIEFTALKYSATPTYNPANTPKTFLEGSYATIPVSFSYATSQVADPGAFVMLAAVSPLMAKVVQGMPGNVNISWLSKLNERYQVQCVTDLAATNAWINIGSEIIGDGLTKSFSDSTTNGPHKYYRIKIVP